MLTELIIRIVITIYPIIENLCLREPSFCLINFIIALWIVVVAIIEIIKKIKLNKLLNDFIDIIKVILIAGLTILTIFAINRVSCIWIPAYCPIGDMVADVLAVIVSIIVIIIVILKTRRIIIKLLPFIYSVFNKKRTKNKAYKLFKKYITTNL